MTSNLPGNQLNDHSYAISTISVSAISIITSNCALSFWAEICWPSFTIQLLALQLLALWAAVDLQLARQSPALWGRTDGRWCEWSSWQVLMSMRQHSASRNRLSRQSTDKGWHLGLGVERSQYVHRHARLYSDLFLHVVVAVLAQELFASFLVFRHTSTSPVLPHSTLNAVH